MTHTLNKCLGFLFNTADKLMANTVARKLKEEGIGISFEQYTILAALWHNETLCQLDLAQLTNRDQASTSRLINTLIKNDLIVRQCSQVDRRVNYIKLTEKGLKLKEPVLTLVNACVNEALKGMSQDEVAKGILFLETIKTNLEPCVVEKIETKN